MKILKLERKVTGNFKIGSKNGALSAWAKNCAKIEFRNEKQA